MSGSDGTRFILAQVQGRRQTHDATEPSLVEGGVLVREVDDGLIVGWWMARHDLCGWVSGATAIESDQVVDVEIYVLASPPELMRPGQDCSEMYPAAVQVRMAEPLGTRQLLIGGVPAD